MRTAFGDIAGKLSLRMRRISEAFDGLSDRLMSALSQDNTIKWQDLGVDEAQAQEIRNSIRSARFSMTDEQGRQAVDSNKRKDGDYFEKLHFVKSGGESLMSFYDDLMVDYPGVFEAVTGSDDAANVLNNFMKGTAKQETNLGDYMRANPEAEGELRAAITDLSSELTGKLFGIAEQAHNAFRLRVGMSEEERIAILKDAKVVITEYDATKNAISDDDFAFMQKASGKEARGYFISLREKIDSIGKKYLNKDLDVEFEFSGGSFGESASKQFKRGRYTSLAKVVSSIKSVFENAIPIEAHADKYKDGPRSDKDLLATYVLLSAVRDGKQIIPVEIIAKEFAKKNNKIHLAIAIEMAEADAFASASDSSETIAESKSSHETTYSISDLLGLINPKDVDFLKYVPSGMLSKAQLESKRSDENSFRLRPALQAGKERIASVTSDDAATIVAQIKPVGLRSLLDPVRMMDRSAADQKTRQLLHEVLEKPFNEAGGEYGRNLQKRSDEALAKMKELGIGKKESQAIQRYGEGVYQDEFGELHPYTETMLRREFPDSWENIKTATRYVRKIYGLLCAMLTE